MARTKTAEQSAVSAAIPVIKTPDDSVHMIQSDLDAIKNDSLDFRSIISIYGRSPDGAPVRLLLGIKTGWVYSKNLVVMGDIFDMFPTASEELMAAMAVRHEGVAPDTQVYYWPKPNTPGPKLKWELYPGFDRTEKAVKAVRNMGLMFIRWRDAATKVEHVDFFKRDVIDFNDQAFIDALNNWRIQQFERRLGQLRFLSKDTIRFYTQLEQDLLASIVHAFIATVIKHKQATDNDVGHIAILDRITWTAVAKFFNAEIKYNQPKSSTLANCEIDKNAAGGKAQRKKLVETRLMSLRAGDDLKARAHDTFEEILGFQRDEKLTKATATDERWLKHQQTIENTDWMTMLKKLPRGKTGDTAAFADDIKPILDDNKKSLKRKTHNREAAAVANGVRIEKEYGYLVIFPMAYMSPPTDSAANRSRSIPAIGNSKTAANRSAIDNPVASKKRRAVGALKPIAANVGSRLPSYRARGNTATSPRHITCVAAKQSPRQSLVDTALGGAFDYLKTGVNDGYVTYGSPASEDLADSGDTSSAQR